MRYVGLGPNLSLGIAIASARYRCAIVMIENMHKHLERAARSKERGAGNEGRTRIDTKHLTTHERWHIVVESCKEVGPALFASLLIITVSFLPVFALEGQEGKLFRPLAFTKTFSMAGRVLSVKLSRAMGFSSAEDIQRPREIHSIAAIAVDRPTYVVSRTLAVISTALVALVLNVDPCRDSKRLQPRIDGDDTLRGRRFA